ncbi:MAG: GntR family transcriptional regulator, partial [Anaerolineaceae bacterium]|nr:GntR family transcriptional regulator [Anaerolineaceae bacterium]
MKKRKRTEIVFEQLLRRLAAGDWADLNVLPPVRQLEADFGASRVTMVAALRRAAESGLIEPRPRRSAEILPGAAQRARDIVLAMHSTRHSRRIAVLLPDTVQRSYPNYKDVVRRIIDPPAARRGLEVEYIDWAKAGQLEFVDEVIRRDFDAALIMVIDEMHLVAVYELLRRRLPIVALNRRVPASSVPSVVLDEYDGSRQLASTFAELGHRNLCLVSPAFESRLYMGEQRVDGWVDYLKETGLFADCTVPVYFLDPREDVNLFAHLLRLPNRPTAVAFGYWGLWWLFQQQCRDFCLEVPGQISLATFDLERSMGNVPNPWGPPVTRVLSPHSIVGDTTVDMLDRLAAGKVGLPDVSIHLDLVVTES